MKAVPTNLGWHCNRAELKVFDNNSYTSGNSSEADIDCMLVQTLSYGDRPGAYAARQDLRKCVLEMMRIAWYPQRGCPSGNLAEALFFADRKSFEFARSFEEHEQYLTPVDIEWFQEHSPLSHGLNAPTDYMVKISESVKHYDRPDLWLGERDADWRIPILLTIREHDFRN